LQNLTLWCEVARETAKKIEASRANMKIVPLVLGDKPKQMRALTTFPVLSAGNYGASCKLTGLLSSTIQVLQIK